MQFHFKNLIDNFNTVGKHVLDCPLRHYSYTTVSCRANVVPPSILQLVYFGVRPLVRIVVGPMSGQQQFFNW